MRPLSRPRPVLVRPAFRARLLGLALAGGLALALGAGPPARAQSGGYVLADTWASASGDLSPDAWPTVSGLDLTPDGRIFLAERSQGRLILIEPGLEPRELKPAPDYDNGLLRPGHLAVDAGAGRLYVADPALNELAVFDLSGSRLASWPNIKAAAGVAVAPGGDVLVASAETGELFLYSPDGFRLQTWRVVAPGGPADLLAGVDAGPDGRMYVVDGREATIHVLRPDGSRAPDIAVDAGGGTLSDIAVDQPSPTGNPVRYWVAASNRLYYQDTRSGGWTSTGTVRAFAVALQAAVGVVVSEPGRSLLGSRVARYGYSPGNGIPLPEQRWGKTLLRAGLLDGPEVVSAGADDGVLVLDRGDRVQRFAPDGSEVRQLAPGNLGPLAVAAAPDGTLFVTSGTRLSAFRPQGQSWTQSWTDTVAPPGRTDSQAVAMVYSPAAGAVVLLDTLQERLRFFAADGSRGSAIALTGADPTAVWADLAVDAAGTLYALDRANLRLHIVEPAGTQRVLSLPDPARRIEAGAAGQLFSLDRDGWVRRYDVSGASAQRDSAFDAARFDVAQRTSPADLALIGQSVYVADRAANLVSRFTWDAGASGEEPPSDAATCRSYPDKLANPRRIDLGDSVEVRLSVRGGCGSQVTGAARDILLILDISGSMSGEKITILREAALGFIADVDFGASRVAVITFSDSAIIEAPLSRDRDAVRRAILALAVDVTGGTAIDAGLKAAYDHWFPRQQPGVPAAFILLSDGGSDPVLATREADRAKLAGVEIFTISIQGLADLMERLATDAEHFFEVDSARFLYGVFEQLADRITPANLFDTITLVDQVPAGMTFEPGSAEPPAAWDPATRSLSWQLDRVLPAGFLLRYRLTPQQPGADQPTNVIAWGDYRDGLGQTGRLDFPVPLVDVVDTRPPTPTPTDPPITNTPRPPSPTPSPTARPTLPPKPIFIPLALNEAVCKPADRHADVILVLDTSSSMAGEKIVAAKAAAKRFVELLGLPLDQAGVVGFNTQATLASPLSGSRAALATAIDGLATAPGTRMDRGLEVALAELGTPRRKAGNTPVIVLLTDGRQDEEPGRAVQAAALARGNGIAVFAIGLGGDVDRGFLVQLAGGTGRTFLAPSTAELARIYEQVAGQVPCPPEVYWGGR